MLVGNLIVIKRYSYTQAQQHYTKIQTNLQTRTQTHIYIYIYIYINMHTHMCVCVVNKIYLYQLTRNLLYIFLISSARKL